MERFTPSDPHTRNQIAAVILLEVLGRHARGALSEEAARKELQERVGWAPPFLGGDDRERGA